MFDLNFSHVRTTNLLYGVTTHLIKILIYFFQKHLSGPESQILESDWLIARS